MRFVYVSLPSSAEIPLALHRRRLLIKLIVFCCIKYLLCIILLYIYLVKPLRRFLRSIALIAMISSATLLVFLPSRSSLIPSKDLNREECVVAFSYMCSTHKIQDFMPPGQTPKATKKGNRNQPRKLHPLQHLHCLRRSKKWQADFLACSVIFQHQWIFFSALDYGQTCSSIQGSSKFDKV